MEKAEKRQKQFVLCGILVYNRIVFYAQIYVESR